MNKNGEITGQAPLGYENYIDEKGKKFVRPKEPDATIIKQLFEMYSLGNTSVAELVHYANIMGLKSRKGAFVSTNTSIICWIIRFITEKCEHSEDLCRMSINR